MKYEFLIIIFLIISIIDSTKIDQTIMDLDKEIIFNNLTSSQKKYFTVNTYNYLFIYKYTFKIKVKNTYSKSNFTTNYMEHSSETPSINDKEYFITPVTSNKQTYGYNTYENSFRVQKKINYLTYVLIPKTNIDSVSITITKKYVSNAESQDNKNTVEIIYVIVIFSIIFLCCFAYVIIAVCRACCRCFRPKPIILENEPQPNYAPLMPQNQPEPQYILPPQYPQQNVNGYAPGQLYTN